MIGKVLYLEAEATGVRATGIGCFFDDPVQSGNGIQRRVVSVALSLHDRRPCRGPSSDYFAAL